jgi:hypothetical protein
MRWRVEVIGSYGRPGFASEQTPPAIANTLSRLVTKPIRNNPSGGADPPPHSHTKETTMSFNHAVVWLDQAEAHVIHFTRDAAESEVIKTTSQHKKSGVEGNHRADEDTGYMDDVCTAISAAKEILIVGPGMEKLGFMRHLSKHHGETAEKVVSVETVDHPNNAQLLAYARQYFANEDITH